ncbi:MAG: agmatinase [Candidatus Aminicenantes bacterium]|nr:agmatinase [Candidatus Aminicenantes bacterium]
MTDFGGALKPFKDHPGADLVIVGIPFDTKSSYLRGAAGGPAAVRAVSTGRCYNPETELGADLARDGILVDYGDVELSEDPETSFEAMRRAVRAVLAAGAKPIVLGGDHAVTYPVVQAFGEKIRPLDILHFDAHPDLYDSLDGDRLSHACPFRRVVEEGFVGRLVQVGLRAATEAQRDFAREHGLEWFEMKDFGEGPRLAFANPLYVSFDLDCLDPAFAPGVSHREPGGLTVRQALSVLQNLEGRIVGLDVVELNPVRDPANITASAAFKIIKEVAGRMLRP